MEQEQGHELAIWAVQVCFQAIPRTQKSAMMQSVSIFISFDLSTGYKAFLDSFYTLSGPPKFSSWGSWSSCTTACGHGTRTGTRTCTSYCDTLNPSKTTETITEDCYQRSCEFKIFSSGSNWAVSDFFQGCPQTDIEKWKNTIVPAAQSSNIALCQINGSAKTVCEIQNNFFKQTDFQI